MTRPARMFFVLFACLPALWAQSIDQPYSAKIKEYTTEPFFLTELVDHLPASDRVPTPEKVLGYVIGTPNKLTYSADIYRYMRELEIASPRVRVLSMGRSEEGRETILVVISDEANMKRLDRYREITGRLADPRKTPAGEAQKLLEEGLPLYWITGSIHSSECGSPEMLMELAYRLAVEETPFVQAIRKNSIVMITPVQEVDGHDRYVDLYNYKKANPGKAAPSLVYWGKYVAHDNNRDGMGLALALSRMMVKTFLEWHPQVLHDLHESQPFLYTSTGMGPYNAWLDPIVISEWQMLANQEVEEMTKRGVPGIWTHGFYDGWAANYMMYVAQGRNAIGRFYETYGGVGRGHPGARGAGNSDHAHVVPPQSSFAQGEMVDPQQHQSAAERPAAGAPLLRREQAPVSGELLSQEQEVRRQGVERGTGGLGDSGGRSPAYRVRRVGQPAATSRGRGASGGQRHRAYPQGGQRGEEGQVPRGSYVIRMDQPYSRQADMLLDTQYYSTRDPRPYDDTGWTLGPLQECEDRPGHGCRHPQGSYDADDVTGESGGQGSGHRHGRLPDPAQHGKLAGPIPLPIERCRDARRRGAVQSPGQGVRRGDVRDQGGRESHQRAGPDRRGR